MKITQTDALLLVDLQNDFFEGGSLAVPFASTIIPTVNDYIVLFTSSKANVIATRDWHPTDHCSFMKNGGDWPVHCVADTQGSQFSSKLKWDNSIHVVSKARDKDRDAYSGFQGTGLAEWLKANDITRIFVCGLATDYCVKHTVLDGLRNGFNVHVLKDAIKAVDVEKGDGERAIEEMIASGAKFVTRRDF